MSKSTTAAKYYWLKLKTNAFNDPYYSHLQHLPDGDSLCFIFLRIQLHSVENGGFLEHCGLCETLEEELAEQLGSDVEKIRLVLNLMTQWNYMTTVVDHIYYIPSVAKDIGCEGASAERMRIYRANMAAQCSTEKEIEIEEELYLETEKETEKAQINSVSQIKSDGNTEKLSSGTPVAMIPPTLSEVEQYCKDNKLKVPPKMFFHHYQSNGWRMGMTPMVDWRSAVQKWENSAEEKNPKPPESKMWMKQYLLH